MALCGWMYADYKQNQTERSLVGVQPKALVLQQRDAPILHLGDLDQFGDGALKLRGNTFVNLEAAKLGESVKYNGFKYTQAQPGLFLVELQDQRIWVMQSPFTPENLEARVALDFASDWVVLEKSSLWPKAWPEPTHGWIVLGSALSQTLQQQSLSAKKPVVTPDRAGTVWIEKGPTTPWKIYLP